MSSSRPTAEYTRVYTRRGSVAHLMRPIGAGSGDDYRYALCPAVPSRGSQWLGTGDQAEYERAASMPLCAVCGHLAGAGAAS